MSDLLFTGLLSQLRQVTVNHLNMRYHLNHIKFLKQPIIYGFIDDKNKETQK